MKVGVVYDFGVNKGGGDFVMLNILDALHNAGHDVTLITSNPSGLYEVVELFDKGIPNVDVCEVEVPYFLKHPYTIAYISKRAIKRGGYDVYIASDDIPKCLSDRRGVCYVHFPHAARFKFKEYVASKYKKTLSGKLQWSIHKAFFPMFFVKDRVPEKWSLIANSAVTKHYTSQTFHTSDEDIAVLRPPVDALRIYKLWRNSNIEKEDLAVCIGRFEPEKSFDEVLHALVSLKGELKLTLIGFARNEDKLLKTIRGLGLEGCVEVLVNADRETVVDRLLRGKAIIHPTPHEPFGIAVVEGMAAGCIPIVRRGFNGPWLEITCRGKYGLGFESISELTSKIEQAVHHYNKFDVKAIASKALEFDKACFRSRFIKVFEEFVAKK